jgi:hypothetical protein
MANNNNNNIQIILNDLHATNPRNPQVPQPFYRETNSPHIKINGVLRQYRRAKSLNQRIEMVLYMYYIGEILEVNAQRSERTSSIRELTCHYFKLAKKVYYLFEMLGAEQIMRTTRTSLTMIYELTRLQHIQLIDEAITIAGARV